MALRAVLAAVAAAAAVLLPAAGPVAAHGGGAVFDVLQSGPDGDGRVSLRVRVTHEADGHPAEGAIVDVAATGPDGTEGPAQRAERTEEAGVYAADLDLPVPGAWTVVVTSSFPPGTVEVPVTVEEAAVSEPPASTSTTGPLPVPEPPEPEVGGAEGGWDAGNLVVAAVSGVVGGVLGLWVSKRRSARKRAAAAD